MRIAVASEDGQTISAHFGRSRCFLVFEIDGNRIVGSTVRDNAVTAHARGECQGDHAQTHQHGHDHQALVSALADCQVVLSRGMGWRAADDLRASGIQAFVIPDESSPDRAVSAFLEGRARLALDFCRCGH